MTKKSAARLERDAAAKQAEEVRKTNRCWDEMKEIAAKCSNALLTANTQLQEIYNTPGLLHFIPSKTEVQIHLRGLSKDIGQFKDELIAIYKMHENKSGGFRSEDEMMESIGVFERYADYQQRYDSTITPTVVFLLQQAEEAVMASQKMIEEQKAQEASLTDPNVISDAVIKEPVAVVEEIKQSE